MGSGFKRKKENILKIWYNDYFHGDTREICHEIKNRNEECCKIMADFFLEQEIIDENCLLIPAPQHEGYAIYTKMIADMIALESDAKVVDIIKSEPRKTLYEYKQVHQKITLNFTVTEKLFVSNQKVFLVDNVLNTGQTLQTCQNLVGYQLIPLVYGISKA